MRLSGKAKHNILKSTGLLATAAEEQGMLTDSKLFWHSISPGEQRSLVTVDMATLKARAKLLDKESIPTRPDDTAPTTLESKQASLEEALDRLIACNDWKSWCWGPGQPVMSDQQLFRQYIRQEVVGKELATFLPDGTVTEADRALQKRMTQVSLTVDHLKKSDHASAILVIAKVLKLLEESEHEYLIGASLLPICDAVCEILPAGYRKTTRNILCVYDLAKLPPSKVTQMQDWLTAKVQGYIPNIEKEKFTLSRDHSQLCVTPAWWASLQPADQEQVKVHKAKLVSCSPSRIDDWVYNKVSDQQHDERVKTSEGRQFVSISDAHKQLISALTDMKSWRDRAKEIKELLYRMLQNRASMQELAAKHNVRLGRCSKATLDSVLAGQENGLLQPDNLIIAMLERELLLTEAKLHELHFDRVVLETKFYHVARLIQLNEPEAIRMSQRRTGNILDGKGPSSQNWEGSSQDKLGKASLERFRSMQAACDLVGRYEAHGDMLQDMSTDAERSWNQTIHLAAELKLVEAWRYDVARMVNVLKGTETAADFVDLPQDPEAGPQDPEVLSSASQNGSQAPKRACVKPSGLSVSSAMRAYARSLKDVGGSDEKGLLRRVANLNLRKVFMKDVWPALFDDVQDRNMYTALQSQLKYITKMQQRASPALRVLETELISGACHDPGAVIELKLVLPLIRERIDAAAQEQAENQSANKGVLHSKALTVSKQLVAEEEQAAARAAAKKAKKLEQKTKKQDNKVQRAPEQPQQQQQQQEEQEEHEPAAMPALLSRVAALDARLGGSCDHAAPAEAGASQAPEGACAEADSSASQQPELAPQPAGVVSDGASLRQTAAQSAHVLPRSTQQEAPPEGTTPLRDSEADAVERLLQCPLSKVMMIEPVIAADGHTYERAAMQEWLLQHTTSPVTGVSLAHVRLVPNVLIRSVVARHQQHS